MLGSTIRAVVAILSRSKPDPRTEPLADEDNIPELMAVLKPALLEGFGEDFFGLFFAEGAEFVGQGLVTGRENCDGE